MSRMRLWTDEEIGFLLEHPKWRARQVGEELGRGMQSVQKMRDKIRRGGSPYEGWSQSEDDYIRATTNLTAEQVRRGLPGRTYSAVTNRRALLRNTEGIRFQGAKNPFSVGSRTLLARTCHKCGLLLDATWYGFNKHGHKWPQTCIRCRPPQIVSAERRERDRGSARRSRDRFQAVTVPHATRHGQPWIASDEKVLSDPDLTLVQKALSVGRTYSATQSHCTRQGYFSAVGRGDATKGQWIIENPNQPEVAA